MNLVEEECPETHAKQRRFDEERHPVGGKTMAQRIHREGDGEAAVCAFGEIYDVVLGIQSRAIVMLAEFLRYRAQDRHPIRKDVVEAEMSQCSEKIRQSEERRVGK